MNENSVRQWGAAGNGFHDDTPALQAALDSGKSPLYFPTGVYRITSTLFVHSHTHILAEPTARIYLCGITQKKRGDFLLTNADFDAGNEDIHITGGVWDGNNRGKGNAKPDIHDENGYSGVAINFFNVNGLELRNMVIANSVTYNLRMSRISDFILEDIGFLSDQFGENQDGLHFGGEVRHGQVRRIRALSRGQTNDDLIALNADDCLTRVENRDLVCGDIEDILFEDIYADDCHTAIRMLTQTSTIRDITIRRMFTGYRCNFINADAARYCRTPIFKDEEFPQGVGHIENVVVEDVVCYPTVENTWPENRRAAILLESHAERLVIRNFSKINRGLLKNTGAALSAAKLTGTTLEADGKTHEINAYGETVLLDNFTDLTVTKK